MPPRELRHPILCAARAVPRLTYPVLAPPGWISPQQTPNVCRRPRTPGSFAGYTFRESGLDQHSGHDRTTLSHGIAADVIQSVCRSITLKKRWPQARQRNGYRRPNRERSFSRRFFLCERNALVLPHCGHIEPSFAEYCFFLPPPLTVSSRSTNAGLCMMKVWSICLISSRVNSLRGKPPLQIGTHSDMERAHSPCTYRTLHNTRPVRLQ